MSRVVPLILAAGRGERLGLQEIPKPMVSIDGSNPSLSNLVDQLLNMNFLENEINLVVGHKKEKIMDFFGNNFIYTVQNNLGNSLDAIKSYAQENDPSNLLVIQGDDGSWLKKEYLQNLLELFDSTKKDTILLTNNFDPSTHRNAFEVSNNKIVNISKRRSIGKYIGFIAGSYVLSKETVSNISNIEGEGLLSIFQTGSTALLNDIPYKSINDLDGLLEARKLYSKIY